VEQFLVHKFSRLWIRSEQLAQAVKPYVLVSNLGQGTDYRGWDILWFSSVDSEKCLDITLN
jgi:hypothetical protein